nr:MAG TPA_asm: hypothetical protein [Caudoviricetes sp.]
MNSANCSSVIWQIISISSFRSSSISTSLFYCLSTNFSLILSVKRVILNIFTAKI